MNYEFPETFYADPENSKYIVAKRTFLDRNKLEEQKGMHLSLLINACASGSTLPIRKFIILDTFTLENVGADLKKFEIEKIVFKTKGLTITVNPSNQNCVYQRLGHSDSLDIKVSIFYDDESKLFDETKTNDPSFSEEKFRLTEGELLGVTLPVMAELFDSMVMHFITYPLYGPARRQTLAVSTANRTYSQYPELVKQKI